MAKKDLAKLVGGLIGTPTSEQITESSTPAQTEQDSPRETDLDHARAEALQITPEMEEQLNARRRERTGRPKGTGRKDKPVETRATFVVNPVYVRKLKYIALAEQRLHKEIVAEALDRYISEWERQNGIIKLPNLAD